MPVPPEVIVNCSWIVLPETALDAPVLPKFAPATTPLVVCAVPVSEAVP